MSNSTSSLNPQASTFVPAVSTDSMNPTDSSVPAETQPRMTLATQYLMTNMANVDSARRELYRLGVKTSYDDKVMIFSALHSSKNNISNSYTQECNGLILEQKTYRPLVVPPRSLRFNIDTDTSNKFLHQGMYHIYKALDGTCFNLYHYEGRWVISTAKGYYMNDVAWDGVTYQTLITECLAQIGLTWESFTSQLNTSNCYSFGFKHPSLHKFREGKDAPIYKIWFIQSVDLDANSNSYLWATDKSPIAIIQSQELYECQVGNLRELYKLASCSTDDFLSNGSICYGFILRSVNFQVTGANSDLFIESSLMRAIRKFWYENHLADQCHTNGWSKEQAFTLHAYLDSTSYELFNHLFRQYQDLFGTYATMLQNVVSVMVWLVRNENGTFETYKTTGIANEKEFTAATTLLQAFKDCVRFNTATKTDAVLTKVFSEFSCHPTSLEVFMKVRAESRADIKEPLQTQ